MKDDKKEANPQQKLFVDEYLKLKRRNQKQAAINAGYSPKTASSQASQLLENPKVKRYLKEREDAIKGEIQSALVFECLDAVKVLVKIMNDPEAQDKDKAICAKDILDRAGFKPTEKVEQSGGLNINVNWGKKHGIST